MIDGIRHKKFLNALCNKIYPVNPILVYLNVDDGILEQRKFLRGEIEYNDRRVAEGNLIDLYNSADFIIDTSGKSVSEIVDDILQMIKGDIDKKK